MNQESYEKMKGELKTEFTKIFEDSRLEGITNILEKYHPQGGETKATAQVLIVSELIEPDDNGKNELDLLCTISVTLDINGKYRRAGFSIIPEGKIIVKN